MAEVILCDGAGDGGIDAAVFVKPDPAEGIDGATWILVQSKYGTALSGPNTITGGLPRITIPGTKLEPGRHRPASGLAEAERRADQMLAARSLLEPAVDI